MCSVLAIRIHPARTTMMMGTIRPARTLSNALMAKWQYSCVLQEHRHRVMDTFPLCLFLGHHLCLEASVLRKWLASSRGLLGALSDLSIDHAQFCIEMNYKWVLSLSSISFKRDSHVDLEAMQSDLSQRMSGLLSHGRIEHNSSRTVGLDKFWISPHNLALLLSIRLH